MTEKHPIVDTMVVKLRAAADDVLQSVVVYGPSAHGDYMDAEAKYNLLVVLRDLSLSSIEEISGPVRWWLKKTQPMPRIFSPKFIDEAADVFPIEFLDIRAHHLVVYGDDPFSNLDVHKDHLRTQCERELREKLMRVHEAFIEAHGKSRLLVRLLEESYPAFAAVFRGCLELANRPIPKHDLDVVHEFCSLADLDPAPFVEIDDLINQVKLQSQPATLFASYYQQLTKSIGALNSFPVATED